MKASWTLFKRELQAIFLSPIAYVFAVLSLASLGFVYYLMLRGLMKMNPSHDFSLQDVVASFFGNLLSCLIQIAVATAITMRLFSEEKRSGTIESLLTAPVTDLQVVMAKYLGALAFYVLLWAPTLTFFSCLGGRGLDPGLLGSAYLGSLLVGALFIAIGCLISSLCTLQVVAAILCITTLGIAVFIPPILASALADYDLAREIMLYFNLYPIAAGVPHSLIGDFTRGLVTLSHLAYPLSGTACCLFLTCKVLQSRSWK